MQCSARLPRAVEFKGLTFKGNEEKRGKETIGGGEEKSVEKEM